MNRPIEGVSTNVAAFVGLAPGQPVESNPPRSTGSTVGEPMKMRSGRAFTPAPWAAHCRDFFENGGGSAVVVAVDDPGTAAVRAGLAQLDDVDLVNLVVLPAESADREDARDTVAEAAAWCERRRAMLLVDPPPGWTDFATVMLLWPGGSRRP